MSAVAERAGVAAHLERIEREMVLQEVRGRLQWRTVDRIESVERWTFEDAAASGSSRS